MTTVQDFRSILAIHDYSDRRWNATVERKVPVFVSYSFYEKNELPSASSMAYTSSTTESFSTAQRQAFRKALAQFEKVTGVVFVETEGAAMVRAHAVTGSKWGGWSNYPWVNDNSTSTGSLVLDVTRGDKLNGYGFEIILHELGHTMGLSHPHEGKFTLDKSIDSTSTTLMSYEWAPTPYSSLRPMDIEALTYLYGGPVNTAGWTHSFKQGVFHASGSFRDDSIMGVRGKNVLNGNAGNDKLWGRESSDTLRGGQGNDVLKGMMGADRLEGGFGNDILWASAKGKTDYTANTLIGGDGNDTLWGSAGNDKLYGHAGLDKLDGGRGNDLLVGGKGDDTLKGQAGQDRLLGEDGRDKLYGADGNDTLNGGNHADTMFGGLRQDTLWGGTGGDKLDGGAHNDSLFGQDGADQLLGQGGLDILNGGRGDDTLDGGKGNDKVQGAQGRDTLKGGIGADTFVYYKNAAGARDRITDFKIGTDHILMRGAGFTWEDARLVKANSGKDVVMLFDGENGFSIHFENVTRADMLASLATDIFV